MTLSNLYRAIESLVIVPKPFVVRSVSRLVNVEQGYNQPWPSCSSRPTRLVAWMYSALCLWLAKRDHQPSRWMSRPTQIIFVAIATIDMLRIIELALEPPPRISHFVCSSRDVSSTTSENVVRSLKGPGCSPIRFRAP